MGITGHSDSLTNKFSPEKPYLQFDKPYYAINDTIWFKAYILNASSLMASANSGLIHIDISNDSDKLVKQYIFPVKSGIGWGNIALDEKDFKTGTYTLRAYTNWMRNFGEETFFIKNFYVTDGGSKWLVTNKTITDSINDKNSIHTRLQFNNPDKSPFGSQILQLKVMSVNRSLYKQKMQTTPDGIVDVNFKLPEKVSDAVIVVENEKKDQKEVIPVNANRPEKTDLQFLPEGGSLVAGLPALVAFKAIGEDGKGTNISGVITDHNQQQLASFRSQHNGMGSFYLNVQVNESYTAKVTLPGGAIKEYALPAIKASGIVLQVKNAMKSDSVEVFAAASSDLVKSDASYFLIGKARGIVCYAAIIDFHKVNYVRRKIAKRLFPSGITHFIFMTTKGQPLNERVTYIDHNDGLHIGITPGTTTYFPKDSVALNLNVTDNTGKTITGSFSLAVTDDAQVKTDSLNDDNIITRMLLTSDLKGYVEDPGYYLLSKNEKNWQELDNLLLTQGWIEYKSTSSNIQYPAEREFEVKGRVSNVFNKPVSGTQVILFSKSPAILMDTVTDKEGRFVFKDFPKIDTPIFILKAVNKHGKSFNVNINMGEVKSPVFTGRNFPAMMPWYVNSDTTLLNYAKTNVQSQFQANFPTGKHVIKEVKIFGKKIVKGSQNMNGPGEADLVLDEKFLEASGKKNFFQLLQENIKGFYEGIVFVPPHNIMKVYNINRRSVYFLVDGVPLSMYSDSADFTRNYLLSHDAQDIKGIEVISSAQYALRYKSRYFPEEPLDKYAFIEITTRGGHGPLIDNTPGMYLYKPLALNWPKQFYKPKYAVKDTTKRLPDLRSTIAWEPDVITDANGKATVWFYAADKPATYTVIVEGSDLNGGLAYKRQKIIINSKAVAAKSK